jgi:N-methylhydantoinase A
MATSPARLDAPEACQRIDRLYGKIEHEGIKHLEADGFARNDIVVKRSMEMRYVGQVHECTVDIGTFEINAKSIAKVKEAFHKRHEELYTYSERHNAVEVVNIESTVFGRIAKPKLPKYGKGAAPKQTLKGHRKAIFEPSGKVTSTPIYDGEKLGAGARIAGPAIIEEVTTTIVIEPGWTAVLDATGSYVITRRK